MATLTLSRALLSRLLAEADAAPDREVCGLLFGEGDTVDDACPTQNVASDPATRFEIDPSALFAAHRAERNGGPHLIGHYHSHPAGIAVPSACDLAAAEPGSLWLILAQGIARAWRAKSDSFEELTMVTVS